MAGVEVHFVGTGGAFAHGGRLQACISLRTAGIRAFLDFGQTSLLGLRRDGIDPDGIDVVIVTHFHADHDGALPFLILDGQFTHRTRPLTIAGPPGIRKRTIVQMEAAIPTLSRTAQRYPIEYAELSSGVTSIGPLAVRALPTVHTPGSDAIAVRVETEGVAIGYTGDTEWTPAIAEIGAGADLLIAEGYSFTKRIPYHLSHAALVAHRGELTPRRIVLTHLGVDALDHLGELEFEHADDGTTIELPGAGGGGRSRSAA